ncbi:FAD-dependent oxidoreductase [Marinilongibacter aquaticus]|uniref:NAD(P)/FAD-dependent oxidoreductase n=1 Tax=Marinilongibacter aquaticus TaxID=2975157 RepID=UPI0021BD00B2|nr:FAD-dependent oxidoreductase [Marinilongibacter aquaticus]UBM59651.1 FAD-dependent oxidoreductase [Marinilongibacter aquaticus]
MHIAIIGNGISGITAAREIRKKSDCKITVISAETDHFFSRTALMYIYMGHMKYEHTKPYEDWFWGKNRIDLLRKRVEDVDFEQKTLHFGDGHSLAYDKLVLATGSVPNKFGWPGQEAKGVQGLYSYQDLESLEEMSDRIGTAVIVGGGLIGVELAEMLLSRNKKVIFLIREKQYWSSVLPLEESEMIASHIRAHGVDLRTESELSEILTDAENRVSGIKTRSGENIACQFVGLTVGVKPNIGFLENSQLETDKGILVDRFLETNLSDVYAIGDCVQHRLPPEGRKPLEQIWYTGKIMGETLAANLTGEKKEYSPGVFFNSAKFFDIEYQTYGSVPAQKPSHVESFMWKHPEQPKLVRINFDTESGAVLGMNTFGIRMRHELWQAWIEEKKVVDELMAELHKANFDPEFYQKHEEEILVDFNAQYSKTIKSSRKRGLLNFIFS